MVTVVEKTLEERAQEKIYNDLFGLTRQIGDMGELVRFGCTFNIFGYDEEKRNRIIISVYPRFNEVQVFSEQYFNKAMRLVQKYEKLTGEEFTLKKQY